MTWLVEKNMSSIVVQARTKQQKRKPRQKSEKPPRIVNHHQEPSKKSCQERRQEITFCQKKTFVKKKPLSRRNRGKDKKVKEINFFSVLSLVFCLKRHVSSLLPLLPSTLLCGLCSLILTALLTRLRACMRLPRLRARDKDRHVQ